MPVRFRVFAAPSRGPWGAAAERVVDVPDAPPEIRLGRRADLELPLPFATLSSVHARIGRDGQSYWLQDAGSTNGTRLEGAPLAPAERRVLLPGAELHLAQVRLRFEGPVPAATTSGLPAEPSEGTATIARRLVADLFPEDLVPTLTVTTGASPRRLPLTTEGHLYLVGRSEDCALPLDVEHISREHAAFIRSSTGVIVRDLRSKNGVLVNATPITADHPVADADTIQIGPVTLTLDDPISRYLHELANKPDPVNAAPGASGVPAVEVPVSSSARRDSSFSRLATAVSVVVLALSLTLALALLR